MEQFIEFYFKLGLKYKDIKSVLYRRHYPDAELIWKSVNPELLQRYVDVKKFIQDPKIIKLESRLTYVRIPR